jgi:GalNAc-alpha-(1->4)-GalNAc-alpha-(1->3)-diNAcBac-PP-undecaprenol alpha-1,4-N-acetyl-D-galactosaminyltransferase
MRLMLVIPSLLAGGAERVMSILANHWVGQGWDVALVTYSRPETDFYPIDPRVERIGIGLLEPSQGFWQVVTRNLRRSTRMRGAIARFHPQVIISFLDTNSMVTYLAGLGLGAKLVVAKHNDPEKERLGWVLTRLQKVFYSRCDALVVLSEQHSRYFRDRGISRMRVIPNPVVESSSPAEGRRVWSRLNLPLSSRYIMAVGRLTRQKGFDVLLDAWAMVPGKDGWRLVIFGEGEERPVLEGKRIQLGIEDSVFFPGTVNPLSDYFHSADLFVLPSRYEGFPMVLVEAMACGLPVIAADCTSSISEIVRDGVNGLLVPPQDPPALANILSRLMNDADTSKRLGKNAPAVLETFSLEKVAGLWEELLNALLEHKPAG